MTDHTQAALTAAQAAGFPFAEIVADGKFHRQPHADHYWIIANTGNFPDGRPWLTVSAGDARENGGVYTATFKWRSYCYNALTTADRRSLRTERKVKAAERTVQLTEDQEAARRRACLVWAKARPGHHHPYLVRKGIHAGNARVSGRFLVVPVYALDGTLVNTQTIRADGDKSVLTGARFADCYHPVRFHGIEQPRCLLAEGYATAMTLHIETGDPVICAFCADNLVRLAKRLPREFPGVKDWVVCGDADPVGKAKAIEAARILGGRWIVPDLTGLPAGPKDTDFNDLIRLRREVSHA